MTGSPTWPYLTSAAPRTRRPRPLDELDQETRYVIGIGNGAVRRKIDRHATGLGLEAATLIHPRATLGRHLIQVGAGGVICAGVVLTTNIRLGRHVHLNLNVTVGHEAVIGDYVSIFPGDDLRDHRDPG